VKLLRIEDAAERLNISKHTLYRWNAEGKGPAPTKLGGVLRYREEVIRAYVEAHGVEWVRYCDPGEAVEYGDY